MEPDCNLVLRLDMAYSIQKYSFPQPLYPASHSLQVCIVDPLAQLPQALHSCGLGQCPQPTLVLVGGASGLDDDCQTQVDTLFADVLAPLAQKLGLCVVDGGTNAGVMRLMGRARAYIGGTFPLVGVAPDTLVNLPDRPVTHPDACYLEPNHTHCFLVPGDQWGDESVPLAQVATHCAQGAPTLTLLVNGGNVAWQDAQASIEQGRRIMVMADSGRTADAIAEAMHGDAHMDARARPLLASGLLSVVDLGTSPQDLTATLTALLTP
jgi:hypothetical protein